MLGLVIFLFFKLQFLFIWSVLFIVLLINRYSDIWIYGFQVIYFTLFIVTYAFGKLPAFFLSFLVLIIVAKLKPYRLNGSVINMFSYSLQILLTGYLYKIFGNFITPNQLLFYGVAIIVFSNYIFTMPLQMKLTPSHWSSFTNRVLWFMTDYTLIKLFGIKLLKYFLAWQF